MFVYLRFPLRTAIVLALFALVSSGVAFSQTPRPAFATGFTSYFDYATFMRFDTTAPPADTIYQSNGFMALTETEFGGHSIFIPAPVLIDAPSNRSDLLQALFIDPPVFVDHIHRIFNFAASPAVRHITYFGDRTVYRAAFTDGPTVSLTVYPVYGKAASVFRITIEKSGVPLRAMFFVRENQHERRNPGQDFPMLPDRGDGIRRYGSQRWPYRLLVGALPAAQQSREAISWELHSGQAASAIVTVAGTESAAQSLLSEIRNSKDLFARATHRAWNAYFASVPLVIPAHPIAYTIGSLGWHASIAPADLVRSELWFWHGVLTTTCQVKYLPGTPIPIADWNIYMGMWGNDGISEAIALASTNRKDIARGALLNWFRYAVNAAGDGTNPWTIFPTGRNTFQATGPERATQSVPFQGLFVGEYVRLTGDTSVLDVKPGGAAGDRTLWQSLVAYQQNLRDIRDINHDHLIDWVHTYESGWDDKDSPFIDLDGHMTSAINEQVFNLWSLQEMEYLSRLRGEDPSPWKDEFTAALNAVRTKLWDPATQRYWDLDASTGKLWTQAENLDAYYFLYYETDPTRISAMMQRLNDPAKFNGTLLPSLAFDTPNWGGYWRGPAWPREYSYVALGLDRAGQTREAYEWLARAIHTNIGPVLPENIASRDYPFEQRLTGVRIMGYDALDTAVFPDIAGLRTWAGQDLTVVANPAVGEVYVRGQKWRGDNYDALFDPGKPTRIWRNGHELPALSPNRQWHATKHNNTVTFTP